MMVRGIGVRAARIVAAMALPLVALAGVAGPVLAGSADPSGVWLTEDGRARIRVEKCGPQEKHLCGYVVWLKVPLNEQGQPRVDKFNPDPKKTTRPSLGHQLVMGLKLNGDGRYEGKIYNADNGKSYDVTIWSEQASELSVKGCMLGFLCGSQTWTRVTDMLPGQLGGPTNGPGGPRADAEWAPKTAAGAGATTGSAAAKSAPKPAAPKPAGAPAKAPAEAE
ncbi:DUF2147 domain-containing protein [Methylobacterium sp. sgz302541]|uniref:DUF2147 domain-containing protein n=1 Tax=unclassified Methylobacterium TaxID=2615210 RepID=UPI003D33A051